LSKGDSARLKDLITELVIYGIGIAIVGLVFVLTFIFTIGIENLITVITTIPMLLSVIVLGIMLTIIGIQIYRTTRELLEVLAYYARLEKRISIRSRRPLKVGGVKTIKEAPLTSREKRFLERAVDYFIDEYGYDFGDSEVRKAFSLARRLYIRLLDMFDMKRAIINAAATAVKVVSGEIKMTKLPSGKYAVESIVSVEMNEDMEHEIFGEEIFEE